MRKMIFTGCLIFTSVAAFSKVSAAELSKKNLQENVCKELISLSDSAHHSFGKSYLPNEIVNVIREKSDHYDQIRALLNPSKIKDVLPNVCLFTGKQGEAYKKFKLLEFAYQSPVAFNSYYGTSLTEEDADKILWAIEPLIRSYDYEEKEQVLCRTNSFQGEHAFMEMLVDQLEIMTSAELSSQKSLVKGLWQVRELLSSRGLDCSQFDK